MNRQQMPWTLLSVVAALAVLASGGGAQQTVVVDSDLACVGCQIELDTVAMLGDREGDGYVSMPVAVEQLSAGEWLVVHSVNTAQIKIFDATGRYLRREGRQGAGPGEYQWITSLDVGPGDTIRVYDAGLSRLTVLSGDFEVMSTHRVRGMKPPDALLPVRGDTFLVATEVPTAERLGYPLHLIDLEGNAFLSFGAEDPEYRSDLPRLRWRSVDWADPGREVWAAPMMRYVVERWDLSGSKQAEIVRDAEWFQPHENHGFNDDEPPNPALIGIRQDSAGRLWTLVRVADTNWRDAVGWVESRFGSTRWGIADREGYYDTILEVIDATTGQLLASQRFDRVLLRFGSRGRLVAYHEDSLGFPRIDVFRATLTSFE